jgi:orotate phosphoribosyltransferase
MMDLLRALEETRAHLHGHFSLSSGLHSDQYFQCAKLLEHPRLAQQVGQELAARFEGTQVDLVVSPALGGILIGHEVAKALGVRFLFGERYGEERKLTLRRGFQVQPGEKILLVEDVITTGGSVLELKRLVAAYGAIVDRRAEEIDLGLRLEALVKIQVNVYKPEECPLCREKIPVTKPGSRDLVAK